MALTKIKTDQLTDESVTTEKLNDGAVTDEKLSDEAIDYGLITQTPEE